MKFKIAFSVFFIVCILYPAVPILGPISIRHILTVIMMVWCALEKGLSFDKFQVWFAVFLFFSFIGAAISGYIGSFVNGLLGTYLAAFVMYWSTKIVIKKYNGTVWVINTILIIAVFNALTAIGQFYGFPFAMGLPAFLRVDLGEDMLEFYEKYDDFHGRYVGGLLGIVMSGYFLSGASVFSLFNNKIKIRLYNWLLFAFLFFALFLVQQRSGVLAAIFGAGLYLILNISQKRSAVIGIVVVALISSIFLLFLGDRFVGFEDMRYSTVGFDYDRFELASNGWNYFLNNPMGGIDAYHAAGNRDPHMVLVLAFLSGGLFGGIVAICILIGQLVVVLKIIIESYMKKKHSMDLIVFSIVYLCYTINSFLHNASLFTGDIMFFVLWAVVVALRDMEKDTYMVAR